MEDGINKKQPGNYHNQYNIFTFLNSLVNNVDDIQKIYKKFFGQLMRAIDALSIPIIIIKDRKNIVWCNTAYIDLSKSKNPYKKYWEILPLKKARDSKEFIDIFSNYMPYKGLKFKIYSFFEGIELFSSDSSYISTHIFVDITKQILTKKLLEVKRKNMVQIRELDYVANFDPLTHLRNRRILFSVLSEECSKSARYGRSFSILFIDIDDLKIYNDKYGHLEGDSLLIHLANLLESNIRNVDMAFRFGGDEFLLVLPETNQEKALFLAERLRILFKKSSPSEKIKIDANDHTISIGVVEYNSSIDELNFIDFADRAMYIAKKEGKNRTCVLNIADGSIKIGSLEKKSKKNKNDSSN